MKRTELLCGVVVVFALLVGGLALGAYKYVDKDGVVHFTDTPTDSRYEGGPANTSGYDAFASVRGRMQALADDVKDNPGKYTATSTQAVSEILPIVEGAVPSGTASDRKFVEIVEGFMDLVDSKKGTDTNLFYHVDRARAARGMTVNQRSGNQPPPVIHIFR